MKILLITLAAALAVPFGLSSQASADHVPRIGFSQTYVSGRASCGCPTYTRRVCRGHDRYQRPLFDYFRQPFRCGCRDHDKKYHKRVEKEYKKHAKDREKHFKKYHKKSKKKHN